MKDYDRLVIWVDYFNSSLGRSEGRRVPLNVAVRNPTLEELKEAVRRNGYRAETQDAAHPKRMRSPSGYVSIERKKPKAQTIREIATLLSSIRGEQRREGKERRG
jgi:signal recognition particle subunit SRP19